MEIVSLSGKNRAPVDRYVREEWGGPMIVTLGKPYDAGLLPGYAAVEGGQLVGAVLYRICGGECEITVLYALVENHGVGSALLRQVLKCAVERGCRRVWLVTTNDNTHAIRFYQRFGFALKAVHIDSMKITRTLKPGLPERGIDGIPLAHEFEFEILL